MKINASDVIVCLGDGQKPLSAEMLARNLEWFRSPAGKTRIIDFQKYYNQSKGASVLPETGKLDAATIEVVRSGWLPDEWGISGADDSSDWKEGYHFSFSTFMERLPSVAALLLVGYLLGKHNTEAKLLKNYTKTPS